MALVGNVDFAAFEVPKMVDSVRIEGKEDEDGLDYQISEESLPVESDEEVNGLVEYLEEESGEFRMVDVCICEGGKALFQP